MLTLLHVCVCLRLALILTIAMRTVDRKQGKKHVGNGCSFSLFLSLVIGHLCNWGLTSP